MRATTRLAVAAATAFAATVTMAPAATADTAVRLEKRGDAPRHIDLTRAVVDNGDTKPKLAIIRVRVKGKLHKGPENGDVVTVWFDRDRDRRPDLRLAILHGWEWELTRVNRWHGSGRWAGCRRVKAVPFSDGHGVKIRIARKCLNNRPVKVAIRTSSGTGDGKHDWFRGRRNFLAPVRR